ncbi:glycosyltransferase family 4 protein [Limnospira platensis]|nr:glycosyl transferase group 1 [Arthrospira platensis C1]UWU45365.1 Glycosyltransferase involved in cell wall bisynthesis [Arthrospira platensis C1]
MKILLIGNYLPDAQQSMQRFSAVMESELKKAGHDVRLLRPEAKLGQLKPGGSGVGKWLGYIDKFIMFPPTLKEHLAWADVAHICDHSNGFYTHHLQKIPNIVTCHDLLAVRSALGEIPENPTGWTGRQLQQIILKGLNKAQRVACVSKKTREDLLRITQLEAQAVTTIYMGLNYPYRPMSETEYKPRLAKLKVPENSSFILHVGGNQWYKNRSGVIQIFAHLKQKQVQGDIHLVIAGDPFTQELQQLIKNYELEGSVISCVNIDNEDLRALYSAAIALLFPSLQEGFGWPIIEAQACGCPVFTSHIPPMTEVGGEVAIYIDPKNPQESATKILDSLNIIKPDPQPLFDNAKRFTTEKMINEYIGLYEQAIADSGKLG